MSSREIVVENRRRAAPGARLGAIALTAAALLCMDHGHASGHLISGASMAAREQNGAAFFGFVRDGAGRGIPGAQVVIESSAARTRLVIQTDAVGHYFFPGFRPDIDARQAELVCSKTGYRFLRTQRNPPVGKVTATTPIEIHCLLEKEAG